MSASPLPRARRGERSLLLADADPAFRKLLGGLLQLRGFEVVAAASGLEALAMAFGRPPLDGVVLDLDAFGLTPVEIIQALRLRQDEHFETWFTTSRYRSTVWRQADAVGAALVLKKPGNAFALCRRIERAFLRRSVRAIPAGVSREKRPNPARNAGRTLCLTSVYSSAP